MSCPNFSETFGMARENKKNIAVILLPCHCEESFSPTKQSPEDCDTIRGIASSSLLAMTPLKSARNGNYRIFVDYFMSEVAVHSNPVKQLLDEHAAFRISCNDLLDFIERLKREDYRARIATSDYALMLKTRENIREHLNVHLIKEEEIFFPRLEKLVPQGRIKFLYLNYDHEYLRDYFDDFCEVVSDFENDRVPEHITIRRLIETGTLIVENLLQHILAEDAVYFELAESGFSQNELDEMGKEMTLLELKLNEDFSHHPA